MSGRKEGKCPGKEKVRLKLGLGTLEAGAVDAYH